LGKEEERVLPYSVWFLAFGKQIMYAPPCDDLLGFSTTFQEQKKERRSHPLLRRKPISPNQFFALYKA
jgi:hypothetical protein